LKIRPSGAIHTGSMFGDGIYFASEDDKSMGYTDGGRWTGSGGKGGHTYMALYDVRVGKQFATQSSDWGLSFSKIQSKGGFDSTWGQKGHSLYRHEYIIYRSEQSTIKFLIEFD
jgi:poly [ADP-ribose] polymerase